jgi:general secretion pathway protein D
VITDYADNLQRLSRIIGALDTPGSTDVEIIPLKHAVAADVAQLVQRLADSSGGSTAGAATAPLAGGGTLSVLPDSRSNALIVRASNPARLSMVRTIVDKLDRESGGAATGNIYVVYLRNADAVKLATVLRSAFASGGGSNGGGSGGTSIGGNFGGSSGSNTNSLATSTAGGTASTQTTSPVSASAGPSTGGFVQADPSTNSLIITAPEPMYRQVRAVIDQLDSRRSQVYVEALIVEVNTSKGLDLGVQWQGIVGSKNSTNIIGLGTNFGSGLNNILGATQALAQGTAGLAKADASTVNNGANFAIAHKVGNTFTLGVLAQALASNSGVNILSTPNLVTLDNEEAKIVVGSNVPFVTGQYTNTGTGTTSPFQTIERKDVGLTLRIRPQIGEGSTVRMTIFQESSAVLPTTAAGTSNAGPSTTKRSIESTVVVDDGQIIVLGGLIDDNYTIDRSKVPLLGDLPWIGGLFRSESRTRNKNNLMVFLRPVVMRSQESANQLTADRYEWMRGQQGVDPSQFRGVQSMSDTPQLPALPNGTAGQPLVGATPAPAVPPASAP